MTRAILATALIVMTFLDAAPATAAAPTWLEFSGGGLKRPILLRWDDVSDVRALDWTWAVSCYSCDSESLLNPDSPRRVDPPRVKLGMPYVLQWKFGPPAAAKEWVVAQWRFYPEAGSPSGLMELARHEGMPGREGMWFAATSANSDLVTRLLLGAGCTRGGGMPPQLAACSGP